MRAVRATETNPSQGTGLTNLVENESAAPSPAVIQQIGLLRVVIVLLPT
jgi:hypothetical protein